ncbi:MAG: hypothetical protein IJS65_08675 [Clostridia bacterium]|nr:hypothetical protein [Clostridia bacterium]
MMKLTRAAALLLSLVLFTGLFAPASLADGEHFTIYYETVSGTDYEYETLETYMATDEYGDPVEAFIVPEVPESYGKICWEVFAAGKNYQDKPTTSGRLLDWAYGGEELFTGSDLYLRPDGTGVRTWDVYVQYSDGGAQKEVYAGHSYPMRNKGNDNRRWNYAAAWFPGRDEAASLGLPALTPLQELYWDLYLTPRGNRDLGSDGAVRVGRFPEYGYVTIGENLKLYNSYKLGYEKDENFSEDTSFDGCDLVIVPYVLTSDPSTDGPSKYRLFCDGPDRVQIEIPVYYSETLHMNYFIVPDPDELGLSESSKGVPFDCWTLYDADDDGDGFYYDPLFDFDSYVNDDIGERCGISGNMYLVPYYDGEPDVNDDPPDDEGDDYGFWYECTDSLFDDGVYACSNGGYLFEYGRWTDESMTKTVVTLPAYLPVGITAPEGKVLSGWNIYSPVERVQGDADSVEDDVFKKGDLRVQNAAPGSEYIFGNDAAGEEYDIFIEPLWTSGAPALDFSVSAAVDEKEDSVNYVLTSGRTLPAKLIAARYVNGRQDGAFVLNLTLSAGETRGAIYNFCDDDSTYKLFLTGADGVPLCGAWKS